MLKTTFVTAILTFSLSSMASIELRSQVDSDSCTIKGNQVSKTTSYLQGELKVTKTGTVKIEGLQEVARRAIESTTSTGNGHYTHELVSDGETYLLNTKDSTESMVLVNMMSRICNTL